MTRVWSEAEQPARRPPALDGLDPRWSRLVPTVGADGTTRTWHVLDTHADTPLDAVAALDEVGGTILCVHGNPTWSYLWRHVLAAAPAGWRVIAVDQLGMGFSERTGGIRRLADRIEDLGRLTAALGVTGPVVTVAHDWGGPISLGWARDHRAQLAGIVLTNTAVHQPAGSPAPSLIRLARLPVVRQVLCEVTPAFLATALALSRPPLAAPVRAGFHAPYRGRRRRRGIADFVADIPLDDTHPSAPALASVIAAMPGFADVPALLLWGPRDPVFSERYLRDLLARLPHADVHRFEGAAHLVTEDRPEIGRLIAGWVRDRIGDRTGTARPASTATPSGGRHQADPQSLSWRLEARAHDDSVAMVEVHGVAAGSVGPRSVSAGTVSVSRGSVGEGSMSARAGLAGAGPGSVSTVAGSVSFAELNRRVDEVAAALTSAGVRRGQRVALLVEPGIELTAIVYACWRIGAVIVVADAGLGLRRLGRALRGAGADWVLAGARGLVAARALRVPGRRIGVGAMPSAVRLGDTHLDQLVGDPAGSHEASEARDRAIGDDADCAVVFTSGATGPPKGVVYRRRQLREQIEVLAQTYGVSAEDRLVAAFAPFALYGPALGIASTVPDVDVTKPATLTAAALAEAITSIDATVVFASPAALTNVVATAATLDDAQRKALQGPRLVLSAGAPLPLALVRQVAQLLPGADVRTPYGMTEVLPVTDISLAELEDAGAGHGVCVGRPVPGVTIGVLPLVGDDAEALGYQAGPETLVDVTGEICVAAGHGKDRYDRLWATEADSSRHDGWHRTGDVGHVDPDGRLWVEGRLNDVVRTADGPVTPVPVEQRIQVLPEVRTAALVAVGPPGARQLVAVVVPEAQIGRTDRRRLTAAGLDLVDRVRAVAGVPLAAVLTTAALPVDIRHNSKIDHPALARAAQKLLAGRTRRRTGADSARP